MKFFALTAAALVAGAAVFQPTGSVMQYAFIAGAIVLLTVATLGEVLEN